MIILEKISIFDNGQGKMIEVIDQNKEYKDYKEMDEYLKTIEAEWLKYGFHIDVYAIYKTK